MSNEYIEHRWVENRGAEQSKAKRNLKAKGQKQLNKHKKGYKEKNSLYPQLKDKIICRYDFSLLRLKYNLKRLK